MTNEVNNETEDSKTDDSPVTENKQMQDAAAPPVKAAEEPIEEPQGSGDIDFGAILEQFEQEQTVFHAGELVEGKVVGVSDRGVLVDFGYKSEGVDPGRRIGGPEAGSAQRRRHGRGRYQEHPFRRRPPAAFAHDAIGRKVWDDIEEAYKNETAVTGRIIDKTKGGLRVDLNGIEAFCPARRSIRGRSAVSTRTSARRSRPRSSNSAAAGTTSFSRVRS